MQERTARGLRVLGRLNLGSAWGRPTSGWARPREYPPHILSPGRLAKCLAYGRCLLLGEVLRGEGVVSFDSATGNAQQSGFRRQRRYFP